MVQLLAAGKVAVRRASSGRLVARRALHARPRIGRDEGYYPFAGRAARRARRRHSPPGIGPRPPPHAGQLEVPPPLTAQAPRSPGHGPPACWQVRLEPLASLC